MFEFIVSHSFFKSKGIVKNKNILPGPESLQRPWTRQLQGLVDVSGQPFIH